MGALADILCIFWVVRVDDSPGVFLRRSRVQ
jgi:hypothetical protein